ncbi:MAG TPA: DUF2090 domain-containing protein, partial [archaeon]|nr:DUF2090 domain-containing protein [archaeon]
MEIGYEKDLLVLPFDHKTSLLKKLYGIEGRAPTNEESEAYSSLKHMVYEGFLESLKMGVPKETAAVLVDDQFGSHILKEAKANGIMTCTPIEKSGQDEFNFEEEDFRAQIRRIDPTIVKVLVRYNPEADKALNNRQLVRLKEACEFAHEIGKKFMFELLVPATASQLAKVNGDKAKYDLELRPKLMVSAMQQ